MLVFDMNFSFFRKVCPLFIAAYSYLRLYFGKFVDGAFFLLGAFAIAMRQ